MRRLVFIAALIVLAVVIAYSVREEAHRFSESECKRCHVKPESNPAMLVESVTKLCTQCHSKGIKTASHPIDMKPRLVRVPLDMPLRNGKLTCNTCHNVHAERFNAFGEKSYFLRITARGKDFCIACHEMNPVELGHRELLVTAHMGRKYMVTDDRQSLDAVSVECIGCHDGSIGVAADYTMGSGSWEHLDGAHPIGTDYRQSRMKRRGLAPVSKIDGRIRLFDGKVGCATCHDPYSTLKGKLVMSNDGSMLCIECHYDK